MLAGAPRLRRVPALRHVLSSWASDVFAPGPTVPRFDDGSAGRRPRSSRRWPTRSSPWPLLAAFLGLVALANWVSLAVPRFRVGGGQVELRQGVLFRQHRQVRLERVQAVELSRPLHRHGCWAWPGWSCSRRAGPTRRSPCPSSTSGEPRPCASTCSTSPAAPTRWPSTRPGALARDGAQPRRALQSQCWMPLHDRCSRSRTAGCSSRRSSTGRPSRWALVLLLGRDGCRSAQRRAARPCRIPAMIPVAIGVAFNRVKELLVHGNFHLADTGTGVRVQEGLTDLRTTTIPIHRIQALELVQPLWWRRSDGGGSGSTSPAPVRPGEDEGQRDTTLLPVGTLEEARRRALAPGARGADGGMGGGRPRRRPGRRMAGGLGAGPAARPPLLAAQRVDRRRRRGAAALGAMDPPRGRGPHARIQSLSVRQGWLEARLGLATVHIVTAPGPVDAGLAHLDARRGRGVPRRGRPSGPGSRADGRNRRVHLLHPTLRGWWTGSGIRRAPPNTERR